jgi:hypothetical protein
LLKKRTYIAPVLAAALALPSSAFADGGQAPQIGLARARPAGAALAPSLGRFHQAIQVVNMQIRAQRRAELRRKRREAFATLPGGVSLETLDAIAACESGGDPTAVSSDGTYRGKFQFDYGTWESVGGSGDPAAASESEQDYRAALLYSEAGSSPWPVCGS